MPFAASEYCMERSPNRVLDLALKKQEVGAPEAIVRITFERAVGICIETAQGGLKVKRHRMAASRVGID